jgi:transposase-like protein
MNIIKFVEEFPDEASCRERWRVIREKEGVVCKRCKCEKHWWLKKRELWQCSQCNFRTSLRSGTMMESSKLGFRVWFTAMAFMSYSKKGISASELQRQLGHSRYETIWSLMHKIRSAMGQRDSLYGLSDMVEFDDAYFVTETTTKEKNQLKRGRGSKRTQQVAVMAESVPLEDIYTGKKSKQCRYFKMRVMPNHQKEEVNLIIDDSIDDKSIVFSDRSTSYVDISDYVEVHVTEKSNKETTASTLKWVHIAIANAKRTLLGIYHKIKGKYLQLYLDEFCYKLNRRYFGNSLFNRLLVAVAGNYRYSSV